MNALALHLPERRGLSRWILAGLIVFAAHAVIVASVAFWYARSTPEPNILPAIAVSLAPVEGSSPEIQNQDIAVGPTMQQAEDSPNEPPKVEEQKVEEPVQPPTPPQKAEVTLPNPEPKPIEKHASFVRKRFSVSVKKAAKGCRGARGTRVGARRQSSCCRRH